MNHELALSDADATATLARSLALSAPERAVVYLHGELGAGKSTLARAWLRALGVTGAIKSPTYTLVERYPLARGEAAHLDLYRLAGAGELDFLGLDELASEARLWLVEWPERGQGGLPAPDLSLHLLHDGPGRRASMAAGSPAGEAWLGRIAS
ncbi:tRNA (adenosine(37)-N6)-threonylcarbamoyltransferase complex ATPase subunit type 1 TsaE [Arenimonas sp. MALMAid1274]|uniref:tRNA (adenosine(37)-N6)-threonylcarbamoyltransferase complex ATPase subunit type 1 TsaE n=1 Tax=Arenimonas sp. MALMAid1274 TaxID=3411630 RepID=UPI003BA2282D